MSSEINLDGMTRDELEAKLAALEAERALIVDDLQRLHGERTGIAIETQKLRAALAKPINAESTAEVYRAIRALVARAYESSARETERRSALREAFGMLGETDEVANG